MMSKYGSMFFYPVYPVVEWPNIIAAKVHLSSAVHRHPLDGTSEKDPHISLLEGGQRDYQILGGQMKKKSGKPVSNPALDGKCFSAPFLNSGPLCESRTIEGLFEKTQCLSIALNPTSSVALRSKEMEEHCQVYFAWREGPMTPPRSTDANFNCAFVFHTCFH